MKTLDEIKKLDEKDFSKELAKARKEVMKLRFEARTGQLAGVHRLHNAKRYVAQILTAKNQLIRNTPKACVAK